MSKLGLEGLNTPTGIIWSGSQPKLEGLHMKPHMLLLKGHRKDSELLFLRFQEDTTAHKFYRHYTYWRNTLVDIDRHNRANARTN